MRQSFLKIIAVLFVLAYLIPQCASAADYIWIEGEAAKSNTVTRHPWWYDNVKKDQFSGGGFISNWNDKQPGEAVYDINADSDRSDTLYVRANPVGAKLGYKLDDGAWTKLISTAIKTIRSTSRAMTNPICGFSRGPRSAS